MSGAFYNAFKTFIETDVIQFVLETKQVHFSYIAKASGSLRFIILSPLFLYRLNDI